MMADDKKHALYMVNPETGHAELVHGDDVESKRASGWVEPTNHKPNGQPYNHENDIAGMDAAADSAKVVALQKSEKAAEKLKAADQANAKARAESDAAKADEPVKAQDSAYKAPYDPSFRPQS